MHEMSLLADLLHKIEQLAQENQAARVTAVKIWLGALAHISPDHLREHFLHMIPGTVAAGASLDIEQGQDPSDPKAQDILLLSLEVA